MDNYVCTGPEPAGKVSDRDLLVQVLRNQEHLVNLVIAVQAEVTKHNVVINDMRGLTLAVREVKSEMSSNYRGYEGWTKEAVGQIQANAAMTKQAVESVKV
jgi:hypothetical protein